MNLDSNNGKGQSIVNSKNINVDTNELKTNKNTKNKNKSKSKSWSKNWSKNWSKSNERKKNRYSLDIQEVSRSQIINSNKANKMSKDTYDRYSDSEYESSFNDDSDFDGDHEYHYDKNNNKKQKRRPRQADEYLKQESLSQCTTCKVTFKLFK